MFADEGVNPEIAMASEPETDLDLFQDALAILAWSPGLSADDGNMIVVGMRTTNTVTAARYLAKGMKVARPQVTAKGQAVLRRAARCAKEILAE